MIRIHRIQVLSLLLLSMVLVASTNISAAMACGVALGADWYKITAKVANNPLSRVLGISFSEKGSLVTFTNRDLKSSLYIASKDTNGRYPGYDESYKSYRPLDNILGKGYDPNVLIAVEDNMPNGVYVFHSGWGQADIGNTQDINSGTVELASVLDSTDNYKSKQVSIGKRPADAVPPSPDRQTMYAFYEGTRYNIDLTLDYSLDEDYDTNRARTQCTDIIPTGKDSITPNKLVILASILLTVGIIVAVVYTRSKKNTTTKRALRKKTVASKMKRK